MRTAVNLAIVVVGGLVTEKSGVLGLLNENCRRAAGDVGGQRRAHDKPDVSCPSYRFQDSHDFNTLQTISWVPSHPVPNQPWLIAPL